MAPAWLEDIDELKRACDTDTDFAVIALQYAVSKNKTDIVEYLVEFYGEDIKEQLKISEDDEYYGAPFYNAVEMNRPHIVKLFLDHNIYTAKINFDIVLSISTQWGYNDIIDIVKTSKPYLNSKNNIVSISST